MYTMTYSGILSGRMYELYLIFQLVEFYSANISFWVMQRLLLVAGWNSNRKAENTSFRYIQITRWVNTCWWALWFYCGAWCERAWTSHVSDNSLVTTPCLHLHASMKICGTFYITIVYSRIVGFSYLTINPYIGWCALLCIMMLMVNVNICPSFSNLLWPIPFQLGPRYHSLSLQIHLW